MGTAKQNVIESIKKLALKADEENKYVSLRDGERPKKGARVIANGKPGEAISTETVEAPDRMKPGQMKDHTMIKVAHPEGTTKMVDGIGDWGTRVAPMGGYDEHYSADNVRVHQDDIVAKK